jgi:hypothetical protein
MRTYSHLNTSYATHCLVHCRRIYCRAYCECNNAHTLGFCGNYFARHRGFRDRRSDRTTVLQATSGFKISSRRISAVHHRCDCSCLSCKTHWLARVSQISHYHPAGRTCGEAYVRVGTLPVPSLVNCLLISTLSVKANEI